MNRRQKAFAAGLSTIRSQKSAKKPARTTRAARRICAIRPNLYNEDGMPQLNQIVQGDSIKVLNDGPEGWVDLCFADPPFNIGYLYHGYNDQKEVDEYVDWSETWMRAV